MEKRKTNKKNIYFVVLVSGFVHGGGSPTQLKVDALLEALVLAKYMQSCGEGR